MNMKSMKTKGLSHRLIALLLCCICMVTAIPLSAIATEADVIPAAEGTVAAEPTEEDADIQETIVDLTEIGSYTESEDSSDYSDVMPDYSDVTSELEDYISDTNGSETGDYTEAEGSSESETTVTDETEPTTETENTIEGTIESDDTDDSSIMGSYTDLEADSDEISGSETEDKLAADALYAKLMACATYEEMEAILNSLTEYEQQLLDIFTKEQNAALEAKTDELGGYETDVLVEYAGKLTIENTITDNGCLTVSGTDLDGKTVTYVWEKSATGGEPWSEVKREKVTGDVYNMPEDGSWVNVALDKGARCYYRAKVATINGQIVDPSEWIESGQVTYYDALQNGSFETPVLSGGMQKYTKSGEEGIVWKTTASDNQIETVRPVNARDDSFKWHSVIYVAEGEQCAEINAEKDGALYQDVLTVPGSTMHWQLSHLGRSLNDSKRINGTDTMYVLIMPYESAKDITTQSQVQHVMNNPSAYPGAEVETIEYTWQWVNMENSYIMEHKVGSEWVDTFSCDDDCKNYRQLVNPWEVHSGTYKVPDKQYLTRYFFVAGRTATGKEDVGNHIDNVWFSTELPPPSHGSANLTIKKTIKVDDWDKLTKEEQQKFKGAVSFEYDRQTINGNQMTWSGNVGTYTFTNIDMGTNDKLEVKVKEIGGAVDGYVLSQNTTEMNDTLHESQTTTVEFINTYTPANKTLTIKKTLSGNMQDENKEFTFTIKANMEMTKGTDKSTEFTFELKKGQEFEISVPVGAKVTVSENPEGYVPSIGIETTISGTMSENSFSFTMPNEDSIVVFNNEKNITVDTGVILDTLPYVLILAAVGVGVAVMVNRRRRRGDD